MHTRQVTGGCIYTSWLLSIPTLSQDLVNFITVIIQCWTRITPQINLSSSASSRKKKQFIPTAQTKPPQASKNIQQCFSIISLFEIEMSISMPLLPSAVYRIPTAPIHGTAYLMYKKWSLLLIFLASLFRFPARLSLGIWDKEIHLVESIEK